MPEYLKNRYKSKAIQLFMTIVALISYVFTKISVGLLNLEQSELLEICLIRR